MFVFAFRLGTGDDDDDVEAQRYETSHDEVDVNRVTTLNVTRTVNDNFTLPDATKRRHIYDGRNLFSEKEAIKVSEQRDNNVSINTVFQKPNRFLRCLTDSGPMIISNKKVQAYQCTENEYGWNAHDLGKVFATFTLEGHHFNGILYSKVKFCNSKYL